MVIFGMFTAIGSLIIGSLAHNPNYSFGSYYPIRIELSSPKLCAYMSKPGPLLISYYLHT